MSHALLYIANSIENASLPDVIRMQSADVEHFVVSTLSIADARVLQDRAYVRPTLGSKRQFLIAFTSATAEAQNALLKILEEPPETAAFYVVVPRSDVLLATVRSRLLLADESRSEIERDALRTFLSLSYGERMNEIADRVKKKDDEWYQEILSGAEEYARCQKGVAKRRVLDAVVYVRSYFDNRGSSKKMLLEELALALPVSKR